MQPRTYRSHRTIQRRRRILITQFIQLAQHHYFTIIFRQSSNGLTHPVHIFQRSELVAMQACKRSLRPPLAVRPDRCPFLPFPYPEVPFLPPTLLRTHDRVPARLPIPAAAPELRSCSPQRPPSLNDSRAMGPTKIRPRASRAQGRNRLASPVKVMKTLLRHILPLGIDAFSRYLYATQTRYIAGCLRRYSSVNAALVPGHHPPEQQALIYNFNAPIHLRRLDGPAQLFVTYSPRSPGKFQENPAFDSGFDSVRPASAGRLGRGLHRCFSLRPPRVSRNPSSLPPYQHTAHRRLARSSFLESPP